MKKILCVVLVLVLAAAAVFAFVQKSEVQKSLDAATAQSAADLEAANAAAAELQAQLDEANAKVAELETAAADAAADTTDADRIAELEAAVELYKPFYDAQIAAEYDGGVIFVDEVMEEYSYAESMYAQYGLDLVSMGYDTDVKQQTLNMMVQTAAMKIKAAELGLDQIDEETMAGLTEEAAKNMETYIDAVKAQFETEDATEEEIREGAIAYLEAMDYTEEAILKSLVDNYVSEQTYNYIVKDVAITEEDVQATYDEMLAAAQESYANDYTYTNARTSGEPVLWNPEGYRQVKHVLVKFSDEQNTKYTELNNTLTTLNAELEALNAPAEETEAVEETAEEAVVRTAEEINADIAAVQADIDALYAELMPKAQEVVDKFNAGTAFAELIETYNEDPGMQNEPTKTMGYAVAATSTTWDPAFTAGAMSIAEVGGISEPVFGSYGIHIIYYEADIESGAVELETVREYIETNALDNKLNDTYTATTEEWTAAINPVYHYDRLS